MVNVLRLGFGFTLLALAGCVASQAAVQPTPAATVSDATQPMSTPAPPPGIRPDLNPKWRLANGDINWPLHDGFDAPPILLVLEPGMLIDRFGPESGHFFSPKGASFGRRAVPYVCLTYPYHVYRVEEPLLAWTGKAAAWFDEPGGATQLQTDASVAQLLADGTISTIAVSGSSPCS